MRNIKLVLRYDGSDFKGWQSQPGVRTVQETLQKVLAEFSGQTLRLHASGRTDSGVHAVGQVAHFHSTLKMPADALVRAMNSRLPDDVAVVSAEDVPESFDANRDAVRKAYRYVIHDGATRNPLLRHYCCRHHQRLDAAAMKEAAQVLLGTHDFRSFETEWPNRKSSVRTITHLGLSRFGDYLWLDVEADGFLYNMVRAIAGTLINVGRGYWPTGEVGRIVQAQDRTRAGPTAPAQGLFLMRVSYQEASHEVDG